MVGVVGDDGEIGVGHGDDDEDDDGVVDDGDAG